MSVFTWWRHIRLGLNLDLHSASVLFLLFGDLDHYPTQESWNQQPVTALVEPHTSYWWWCLTAGLLFRRRDRQEHYREGWREWKTCLHFQNWIHSELLSVIQLNHRQTVKFHAGNNDVLFSLQFVCLLTSAIVFFYLKYESSMLFHESLIVWDAFIKAFSYFLVRQHLTVEI